MQVEGERERNYSENDSKSESVRKLSIFVPSHRLQQYEESVTQTNARALLFTDLKQTL